MPSRTGSLSNLFRKYDLQLAKKDRECLHKLGYRTPLLTREDFQYAREWYDDVYLTSSYPRPYIQFALYKESRLNETRVRQINIIYTFWDQNPKPTIPEYYTLLLSTFDSGHPKMPVLSRLGDLPYEFIISQAETRRMRTVQGQVPGVFGNNSFFTFAPSVWNEYCLLVGNTSISRLLFCSWVYRFTALATDLIDYPFMSERDMTRRGEVIAALIASKYGELYDCYDLNRWRPLLQSGSYTAKESLQARFLDARDTYRKFIAEVRAVSPLEKFLHAIAGSLYGKLCKDRLLKRCPICGDYFVYSRLKKYCSPMSEGKNCGKTARNRRTYLSRKKKNPAICRGGR